MAIKKIQDWILGQIDNLEARSIPRGSASSSNNWLTVGDKMELRRGRYILGNQNTGAGAVKSLIKAKMSDGSERLYRTEGKKLEYYNSTTEIWGEVGTNVLGTAADGEKVSFAEYHSLAGDQLFINSPNGPYLKIMLANPTSYTDVYDSTKNFKGHILIKQNRTFLWGRNADKTGVYGSKIDTATYTTVSSENIGTGDGTEVTFADTLAFKAGGSKRTCFAITATDGTETFTDNNDGTLTGSAGGTGTINYTSGSISVTFNTAPTNSQAITSDYQWEDVTVGGICDYTESGTRLAGEGFVIRQDDGGNLQNIFSLGDQEYCVHEYKTWVLTLTADDTNATNLIYRQKIGIPNRTAGVSTGDGIYIIGLGDDADYEMQLIGYYGGNDKILPRSISKQHTYKKKQVGKDLSSYTFDQAFMFEWGDYILCTCRTSDSAVNNTMIVYNKVQKLIDITDYYANTLAEYSGTLIAGDPLEDNVYTFFSGWDDDDSEIPNYRELNEDNLDFEGLKKVKDLIVIGEIQKDQQLKVSVSVDNGGFVEVGTILGTGDYVDAGQEISVGRTTVGSKTVGGESGGEVAFRYVWEKTMPTSKFNLIKLRFEALVLGYVSVTEVIYDDIRTKSRKIPTKYVS